jgi:hypothetical protein
MRNHLRCIVRQRSFLGLAFLLTGLLSAPDSGAADGASRLLCVPWQGDPTLYHPTYPGREICLKAVWRDAPPGEFTYFWDFGNGAASPPCLVQEGQSAFEVRYVYNEPIGKTIRARLILMKDMEEIACDEYRIMSCDDSRHVRADIAVDDGLWYLFKLIDWTAQFPYPAFSSDLAISYTAGALEAFLAAGHGLNGDSDEDPYVEAANFYLRRLIENSEDVFHLDERQSHGYPEDYNDDGVPEGDGRGFQVSGEMQLLYAQAICLVALASTWAPDFVPVSSDRNLGTLVQDMVDFCVWAQSDTCGGWRYRPNFGDCDNSVSPLVALGVLTAEKAMEARVPPWARAYTRDDWIPHTQSADGGFGYMSDSEDLNMTKAGGGLILLAWSRYPSTDPRVDRVKDFIAKQWSSQTWGDLYAMYRVMKGAAATDPPIRLFGTNDWYKDYATWLVENQEPDGRWSDRSTWEFRMGDYLPTAWSCVILKSKTPHRPTARLEVPPGPIMRSEPVALDGTLSIANPLAPDGTTIAKYIFDFGDGFPQYIETPSDAPDGIFDGKTTHVYGIDPALQGAARSSYRVALVVVDSQDPQLLSQPAEQEIEISDPTPISFIRGDANADGFLDLADAVSTFFHLFQVDENTGCRKNEDTNDDGEVDISDPVFTLTFLFLGGVPVPQPSPECGTDPTLDDLPCANYPPCP